METEQEITKVKSLVLKLLEEDERCRNDDKWLTFRVMQHFTKIFIPFDDFKKIPAFETIKRTRAHIQNFEKKFPSTDETAIKRRKKRQNVFSETFKSREVKNGES